MCVGAGGGGGGGGGAGGWGGGVGFATIALIATPEYQLEFTPTIYLAMP